jgi:hypothetical protein
MGMNKEKVSYFLLILGSFKCHSCTMRVHCVSSVVSNTSVNLTNKLEKKLNRNIKKKGNFLTKGNMNN